MQTALMTSALLMGLAGGPHCVAMCGTACAGVIRIARIRQPGHVAVVPAAVAAAPLLLHLGRVGAYAAAGALAAVTVQALALASAQVTALRPLWILVHAAVLAWGLVLAASGRQPLWARRAGNALAIHLRPMTGSAVGMLALGAMWVSMPCGLLYSALMLAGMASGPLQGALAMALFALGSGLSLWLAPWAWHRLHGRIGQLKQAWGTRVAGLLLAALALQAIWIDLARQIVLWCG